MTADAVATHRPLDLSSPLRFLPESIRVAEHPLRAVAVGWLTAFPVSMIFALLAAILPGAKPPEFHVTGVMALFGMVIFSPIVETLVMGAVLLVLLRFLSPTAAILTSAIGWGIVHSLIAPAWGLAIWWPFLVFSTLFVTWRSRSLGLALLLPMLTHAAQNLIPSLLVAYGAPA